MRRTASALRKRASSRRAWTPDLLLFSPENVREHGTYVRPNLPATGFDEVFVLGERVIENGVYRGGSSGEMLGARMGY